MIYLLRHAETEWNFQLRKQGLDDSPLTRRGLHQAESYGGLLLKLLQRDGLDTRDITLYVSPLGRTRITADFLVQTLELDPGQVRLESRLVEFDYGDWSGLTNHEIEIKYPGALQQREQNKWHYTVPGGQSYADIEVRVDDWLSELSSDSVVVAVTHSVVSRVIRCKYAGMDYQQASNLEHLQDRLFRLHNGEITEFDIAQAETLACPDIMPQTV